MDNIKEKLLSERYIPITKYNKSIAKVDGNLLNKNTKARKLGIKKFPYIEYIDGEMSYYETADGWWESNETILLKNNVEKKVYKDASGLLVERRNKYNILNAELISTSYKSNVGHVRINKINILNQTSYFQFDSGDWEFKKKSHDFIYSPNPLTYITYDSDGLLIIKDKFTGDLIYTTSDYIIPDYILSGEREEKRKYNLNYIAKKEYNGIFTNNCIDKMNPGHIDWDLLSCYQYIPDEYIKKYYKYWNKKHLKFFQNKKYFGDNPSFKGVESIY